MSVTKIQSISDIITNSSSEVFCRIESENHLELIKEILDPLFPGGYYDDSPVLEERNKGEGDAEDYVEGYYEALPDRWLEISLPYSLSGVYEFYKAGLEAILSDRIPDDYTITYDY